MTVPWPARYFSCVIVIGPVMPCAVKIAESYSVCVRAAVVRQLNVEVPLLLAQYDVGIGYVGAVPNWYYPSIAEYTALLEQSGLEPISAVLFDRMTRLEGDDGHRNWISMFVRAGVDAIPAERREEFFAAVEEELRGDLYRDGAWYADYRRLRVVAKRVA